MAQRDPEPSNAYPGRDETDPGDPRLETGEAWRALCASLDAARDLVLGAGIPDAPRDRAEGFRYLARFLAAGLTSCVTHDDPDYPVFGRMIDYTTPWGLDNPDCLYLYAPLRGDATYRIWGRRGTARHVDIQVNSGHYSAGEVAAVRTLGSLDGFGLECDADGRFELRVGGEPNSQSANWIASGADAEFVLVRQYFADWETETPADLWIEREGAHYPMPPPRSRDVADRLEKLQRWFDRGARLWEQMSRGFLAMEANSLIVHQAAEAAVHSGMRGQAYGLGNFVCPPDRAVIIEFTPPRCHHWGIALANEYWECIEYATHQSSINGHQMRESLDGSICAVISQRDPGVANWLDPAGRERGTLSARFLDADSVPTPRVRSVPFDELEDSLPEGVPRIDGVERERVLRARRNAIARRFRH